MFILKVIRPKSIPNRKSAWGYRVRFYHWLLIKLLPLYRRCAISDTINTGDTQLIHNVRDYWYEQELQRFNVDTAQHMEKQAIPFVIKGRLRRYSIFNWSESLLLFHAGKSYNIKRTNTISIESDIDGQLKVSQKKDIILRSEFVAKSEKTHHSQSKEEVAPTAAPRAQERRPQGKVHIKDSVPGTTPKMVEPKLGSVKYRGFEENSIF